MHRLKGSIGQKDELLLILCLKMQHDLRWSVALSVQRILIKIFSIDVKGGGKTTKGFYKEYCHQCQRGRLLAILSLMAKALGASETTPKKREKKRTAEKNKELYRSRNRFKQ